MLGKFLAHRTEVIDKVSFHNLKDKIYGIKDWVLEEFCTTIYLPVYPLDPASFCVRLVF